MHRYATESINLACKWAYNGVHEGETLSSKFVRKMNCVYLHGLNEHLLTNE
jgi:hypothetical protein